MCIMRAVGDSVWAGTTPKTFLGAQAEKKGGRSSPTRVHAAPKSSALSWSSFYGPVSYSVARVNVVVNGMVNRSFQAPFT